MRRWDYVIYVRCDHVNCESWDNIVYCCLLRLLTRVGRVNTKLLRDGTKVRAGIMEFMRYGTLLIHISKNENAISQS